MVKIYEPSASEDPREGVPGTKAEIPAQLPGAQRGEDTPNQTPRVGRTKKISKADEPQEQTEMSQETLLGLINISVDEYKELIAQLIRLEERIKADFAEARRLGYAEIMQEQMRIVFFRQPNDEVGPDAKQ